ncbi:hypothetical protein QX249_10605 [Vibrio parahaemolyticus]|uniref:Uncharacterized protein n=1 Tax=Vibrio parahaemolyticus TaxID=670 RepID=A0AAW8PY26_VIBPH|nr:hypothetical protein [Vibrio parahaemolyticus]MDS1821111.1 hypothetical protein [Vibrio parahaemolyticus]
MKEQHEFSDFTLVATPESPETPMEIQIKGEMSFKIDVLASSEFHCLGVDPKAEIHDEESLYRVCLKLDRKTNRPPEISFYMPLKDVKKLLEVSVVPVDIGFNTP